MNFSPLKKLLDNRDCNLIPQCEVIVYKNNEKIFEYFTANRDIFEEEKTKNLYFLYSATKVITSTAIMRLYQEGKLDIKDAVSKYIPEFAHLFIEENGQTFPAKNVLTIEHLLSMQGGMTYNLGHPAIREFLAQNPQAGTLETVKQMAKMNLSFEPGTNYQYSLCHDVLAGVAEVVTGKKFFEYLDEIIFKPLDIKNISFNITDEKADKMHRQYAVNNYNHIAEKIGYTCPFELAPNYQSGGAGLIADPQDYAKIIDCLASGKSKDGYTILNKETIDFMCKNRLNEQGLERYKGINNERYGYGYGLGVRSLMDAKKAFSKSPVGEYGWDGAAGAYVLVDTENKLSIFYGQHVLNCRYVYLNIHPAIRNIVYDIINE